MWSCDQSLVNLGNWLLPQFYKDLTRKTIFWGELLVQVQWFGSGTRSDLEIWHQCDKRVNTKTEKVFRVNSYVCRSNRGKTDRGAFCHPSSWIGLEFFFFFFFFSCYLVAPRPTLGHSQGDSLMNPMLIIAFYLCRPEGHREPRNEAGSLNPAKRLVGFELGTFRF